MSNLLDPFLPSSTEHWSAEKAAHLMRRAGFGARPAEVVALAGDCTESAFHAAVDGLVDFTESDPELDDRIASVGGFIADPKTHTELSAHLIFRMRYATAPLREQLALFFHDHFATEYRKIRSVVQFNPRDPASEIPKTTAMVKRQYELMRTQGMGEFRNLLLNMSRDPAMLMYLDNQFNSQGKVQENYARELLELFSMGPFARSGQGNYTENDVKEIARVLTGFGLDSTRSAANYNYAFKPSWHDYTPKTVFGATIPATGESELERLMDLIIAHPSTADFMARKLLMWFVTPFPDDEAIDELAATLRATNFNFRETLRTLLKSRYFYESRNFFTIYRNPVDFFVHHLRQIEFVSGFYTETGEGWVHLQAFIKKMGMQLYSPPNVAGWHHHRSWASTSGLMQRYNAAEITSHASIMIQIQPERWFATAQGMSNDAIINEISARLLQGEPHPEARAVLNDHLEFIDRTDVPNSPIGRLRRKVAALIHLMACMPSAHLK